jgi:hypothetical protein
LQYSLVIITVAAKKRKQSVYFDERLPAINDLPLLACCAMMCHVGFDFGTIGRKALYEMSDIAEVNK